jgi:hypothetical protein
MGDYCFSASILIRLWMEYYSRLPFLDDVEVLVGLCYDREELLPVFCVITLLLLLLILLLLLLLLFAVEISLATESSDCWTSSLVD